MRQRGWRLAMKIVQDRVLAVLALVVALPIIIVGAAVIRFVMGSPVFFRQTRPGKNGKPFEVIKFRTLTNRRDGQGNLLQDSERLTSIGSFLRSTSIDELPQLWNILKGEMSWVGPRPLLMQYLPLYSNEQQRRHDVIPGITGWAQVRGRNSLTWDEKFALDIWYVDNWSLALDLRIMVLTAWIVLSRRGVSSEGHVTMPPFEGSSHSR